MSESRRRLVAGAATAAAALVVLTEGFGPGGVLAALAPIALLLLAVAQTGRRSFRSSFVTSAGVRRVMPRLVLASRPAHSEDEPAGAHEPALVAPQLSAPILAEAQVGALMPPQLPAAILPDEQVEALVRARPAGGVRLKRAVDVVFALTILLFVSPLMLLIALAVRLDSSGPAVYRQRRVGYGGREFIVRKYRTMVADAEARREALLARSRDPNWLDVEHDPRITRVGRFLRLSSLDELPQLWNVVRGDMSLVGPRPLIPEEHDRLPGWARLRVTVPPGVTGLWQVSGRTSVSFEDMLRLDCLYIRTWSFGADLMILLRTIPAVLSRRGAN